MNWLSQRLARKRPAPVEREAPGPYDLYAVIQDQTALRGQVSALDAALDALSGQLSAQITSIRDALNGIAGKAHEHGEVTAPALIPVERFESLEERVSALAVRESPPDLEARIADLSGRYDGLLQVVSTQLAPEIARLTLRIRAMEGKMGLEALFTSRKNQEWSVNQHMDTLRSYGRECEHITELGTNVGFATIAFLAARPKKLVTYDIERFDEDIRLIEDVARDYTTTEFIFIQADTREVEIEPTDLLFIDTLHDYAQVKQELVRHGNQARKYLIFHDTVGSARLDETPHAVPPPVQGIMPAIEEFLAENPHWKLHEHYAHQYGLSIYRRADG